MDVNKIKSIVNSQVHESYKRNLILQIMAKDEDIIPDLLEILNIERKSRKELLTDMNLELSRAHIYIDDDKKMVDKSFVLDKISEFYIKYKGMITHCFNRFN